MNRIIFFIILLGLTSINLSAQKISVDRIEEDGSHQIMTNTMDFYVGERIYSFGMKVFETTHSNNWLLLISSKFNISNNCKVLFKLVTFESMLDTLEASSSDILVPSNEGLTNFGSIMQHLCKLNYKIILLYKSSKYIIYYK